MLYYYYLLIETVNAECDASATGTAQQACGIVLTKGIVAAPLKTTVKYNVRETGPPSQR